MPPTPCVGLLGQHFDREGLSSSLCQPPSPLCSAELHMDEVSAGSPSRPPTFTWSVSAQRIP